MYLTLDIEKLYADKDILHEKYVEESGDKDENNQNIIRIDTDNSAICEDYWEDYELWLKEQHDKYSLDLGVTYTPSDKDVVHVVEKAIDNVNDKALVEIFGFVAKKINKLKSALESLRGL